MVEIMGRCIILNKIYRKLFVLIFILFFLTIAFYTLYNKSNEKNINVDCVPNENVAINIAKIIIPSVYPEFDCDKYNWGCIYNKNKNDIFEENIWIVYCFEDSTMLGGGLPEIHIKKDTGEVVFVGLMA